MNDGSPDGLGDLDPELRSLFAAEATYSDMPANAPAQILAKVSAGLLLVPPLAHAPSAPPAPAPPPPQGAATAAWHAAKRMATWVAFGAGAATGAGGYATAEHVAARAHRATPSAVVISSSVAASDVLPAEPSASSASAPSVTIPPAATPIPSASPRAPDATDADLAAEHAQLEIARTALGRGQADAALATLRADARQRPHGRLAEERDSLTIQALALAGRTQEAQSRAAAFARHYPRSLFLPVVNAAVAGSAP